MKLLPIIALFFAFSSIAQPSDSIIINPANITIARDTWGVAHIFARTNPEVAYGLAWANCEDAFPLLQEMFMTAQGNMGRYKGKSGAAFDFFVHTIGAAHTVDTAWHTLSPDYLRYINGYCQGINAYAAAHPTEILLPRAFPVQPKDVVKAYLISFAALAGNVEQMQNIVNGKFDKRPTMFPIGSNAYAFNSRKTTDGKTYLCMNPHFFIEGGLSFYEAHLHSDEGLNITGALFHGGTTIFMGNNPHLGWGQTYNYIDQVDVYELNMHPTKKLYYKLDNQYIKLQKRPARLRVRVGKWVLPVRRRAYWSQHGAVLRSPDGRYFALRSPAFGNVRAGEEYYRMNMATNFEEFRKALDMNSLNMFNIVYADKKDNIFYISNGRLPKRNPAYNYLDIVAGDKSDAIWTAYYTQNELPQVKNPGCGYVVNTNHTPALATCEPSNFSADRIDPYINLRAGTNNRYTRFIEQLYKQEKFDFQEFKRIKFDLKISRTTQFFRSLHGLYNITPEHYPHIEEAIRLLQRWDGNADATNTTAALFMLTMENVFAAQGYSDDVFIKGVGNVPESVYIESIERASHFLIKYHGSIKTPMSKLFYHERNGELYPATGYPDALCPAYGKHFKDGKYKMTFGDTYIHFVKFNHQGAETIETLLPFEKTRTCEQYADELEMLHRRELKKMSLDKADILKKSVKRYHPIKQKDKS